MTGFRESFEQIWQAYSGEAAWQMVVDLCRFHRIQASPGYRRAAQQFRACGAIQRFPVTDLHSAAHTSIFSTGSTSSELAPAAFRFSSVSQKTFSRQTA